MPGTLEKHRSDLTRLVRRGEEMLIDLSLRNAPIDVNHRVIDKTIRGCFERQYQHWYTEAQTAVAQLIPARSAEFEQLYLGEGKRISSKKAAKSTKTADADCTIQDWLTGRIPQPSDGRIDPLLPVTMRLKTQLEILQSAEARFESVLFDMRQLLRADLFDSELDACRELASHGFLRAAGALAGVILEKHLRQTAQRRNLVIKKTEPTITDFNDRLKKAGALDTPTWRKVQRLGDIRNLCGHDKNREPTREEVEEIMDGTENIVRTLS
jgi:hypothetical protein